MGAHEIESLTNIRQEIHILIASLGQHFPKDFEFLIFQNLLTMVT